MSAHQTRKLTSQRIPEKMSQDRAALDELFASTTLAHVAFVAQAQPQLLPTAFAVFDNRLLIHGSTGSPWMRQLIGVDAAVSITKITGLVVARSTFESSVHFRSAVVYGTFTRVAGDLLEQELHRFSNRLIPGRADEVRRSTSKELAATMLLEMPVETWSLRVSQSWPKDEPGDIAGDAWAGVIRLGDPVAEFDPAPNLRSGIPVPRSVSNLTARPQGIV